MKKVRTRSVRIDEASEQKWNTLSRRLGVSPNKAFLMLIENAEIVSQPQVSVKLNKNSHCAPFHGQSAMTVEA